MSENAGDKPINGLEKKHKLGIIATIEAYGDFVAWDLTTESKRVNEYDNYEQLSSESPFVRDMISYLSQTFPTPEKLTKGLTDRKVTPEQVTVLTTLYLTSLAKVSSADFSGFLPQRTLSTIGNFLEDVTIMPNIFLPQDDNKTTVASIGPLADRLIDPKQKERYDRAKKLAESVEKGVQVILSHNKNSIEDIITAVVSTANELDNNFAIEQQKILLTLKDKKRPIQTANDLTNMVE